LIIVEDKAKVLEMEAIFENLKGILIWWCTSVMIEAIWNMIKLYSGGVDVLIGTPNKLAKCTTAGFNVNRLKMFIIDDADSILKLRHETKLMRCQTASIKRNVLSSRNDFGRIESLSIK
jgi:superfamily II DNA/RNA helicase